jgi:hypothetical protein
VGNAILGLSAACTHGSPEDRLRAAVRATGNGTFVAFASPFVLAQQADRRGWWAYIGAHAAHLSHLVAMARRGGASFSATSRYGGAAAYATLVALGATGYSPGGAPCREPAIRALHHAGERFLFGLYGFTIVHGFLAKGRHPAYPPLAVLWLLAAARGRARWTD